MFLFISLIFILAIGSTVLTNRWTAYKRKADSVVQQKHLLGEAQRQIETLLEIEQLLESSQAQEKLLREKMDYARDNEIIFQFQPMNAESSN